MRNSDRWVTPGVIVAGLLAACVCVLATIAAVVWLSAHGIDPDPMLKLVGIAVTALGSLGSFVLSLANRRTVAKTERNTGVLADVVETALADPGRHAYSPGDTHHLPPVPPVPHRKPPLPGAQLTEPDWT